MAHLLLIDNDAILKLGRYDLLSKLSAVIGSDLTDVRTLPTAKYTLLPAANRLKRCKDPASANRVEAFLATSTPLEEGAADAEVLDQLNESPGIDSGEALLIAAAAANSDAVIITGDKRALLALCSDSALGPIAATLSGRIISLEILLEMYVDNDFENTQQCVRSQPDVDKALSIIFGKISPRDEASVRDALGSYTRDLQRQTGPLLYKPDKA